MGIFDSCDFDVRILKNHPLIGVFAAEHLGRKYALGSVAYPDLRIDVHKLHQGLREHGPVAIPRAFVFMDRAAIGLGAAFIRLQARLNFSALFDQAIEGFSGAAVGARQLEASGERDRRQLDPRRSR